MHDAALRWKPVVDRAKARLAVTNGATPRKVEAALDDAVTACEALLHRVEELEAESHTQRTRMRAIEDDWEHLFQAMPIACVMTDVSGAILRVNDRAAGLLNTSARHLEKENKPLTYFAQDRQALFNVLRALSTRNGDVRETFPIRPRERAPIMVEVSVVPRVAADTPFWLWFLIPRPRMHAAEHSMAAVDAG